MAILSSFKTFYFVLEYSQYKIRLTVNPKGNQSWIFIGKTDAEAEAPILWPPDEKNWLIGKDPDAGKDRRRQWQPTPVLLPGKSHGRRSLVGCSSWGHQESDTTEQPHFHSSLSRIGEGNGKPLQCSCLENPRDGGAWWAAVYGIAQSRTRLKWLSSSSSSWERLKAGGEGDDRLWDSWMTSPTRWSWVE